MSCPITGDTVNIDESCNITATLYDAADPNVALNKAAIITLTATLVDVTESGLGTVINSRNAQDILDTNGGTVAAGGELTLRLEPADNPNVNATPVGEWEQHQLTLEWTWNDGVAVRTGLETRTINVGPVHATP